MQIKENEYVRTKDYPHYRTKIAKKMLEDSYKEECEYNKRRKGEDK